MKILYFIILFMLLSLFSNYIHSKNNLTTITHINEKLNKGNSEWEAYFIDLLMLALEETKEEYGEFILSPYQSHMEQNRKLEELEKNNIDIVWTMTSIKRENNKYYHPIRIPLFKGLLGYRIFIIRSEDEDKYKAITHLDDLKKLMAGQVRDWPDYTILKNNNIPTAIGTSYNRLFNMLAKKRYDYFPRGVMEPWNEIKIHKNKSIMIEKELMLHYPTAIFFFVNKKNKALYKRIEKGLMSAINNGNFDHFIYNHRLTKNIFEKANLNNRRVFELENELTPLTKKVLLNNKFIYQPD